MDVVWYFLIIPRLKHLFVNSNAANDKSHVNERKCDKLLQIMGTINLKCNICSITKTNCS